MGVFFVLNNRFFLSANTVFFLMGIQNDPSKKYSNIGGFQVGFARFVLTNIQISMVFKGCLRDSP